MVLSDDSKRNIKDTYAAAICARYEAQISIAREKSTAAAFESAMACARLSVMCPPGYDIDINDDCAIKPIAQATQK